MMNENRPGQLPEFRDVNSGGFHVRNVKDIRSGSILANEKLKASCTMARAYGCLHL